MYKLFIALVVICFACNQSARDNRGTIDTHPTDGTELNDTVPAGPDTTLPPQTLPAPQGLYRVTLPGQREHSLIFYPGHRYRLEEKGAGGRLSRTAGEWKAAGVTIALYRKGVLAGQYRRQDSSLVYLLKGKEYRLEKALYAMDNTVWRNKKKAGAEFFGVGNEPFWNIEIDEQKAIAFHLSEWSQPMRFPPATPKASGDSLQYTTAIDSATLRVVVYHRFCSDGMSDYTYDQAVKVIYNNTVYTGCGLLFK